LLLGAGSSPSYPIPIKSLPYNTAGSLQAGRPTPPEVVVGNTTLSQFARGVRGGSAAHYSLNPARKDSVTIGACSNKLQLQMAVFVDKVAAW
jgi:hypothetical protein